MYVVSISTNAGDRTIVYRKETGDDQDPKKVMSMSVGKQNGARPPDYVLCCVRNRSYLNKGGGEIGGRQKSGNANFR